MEWMTPWQRAVASLALVKVIAGLTAFAAALFVDATVFRNRDALMVTHVIVYGVAAFILIAGTRRDRRAMLLGVVFLLSAGSFSDNALVPYMRGSVVVPELARALILLPVDAFTPWLTWLFVQEFPRVAPFGARHKVPRLMGRVAFAVGVPLFAVSLTRSFLLVLNPESALAGSLTAATSANNSGIFWIAHYALILPALGAMIWKARVAPIAERRRVSVLLAGLIIGSTPTALWVFFASLIPAVYAVLPLRIAGWVLYPTMLSTPLTTAYAVLAHQALDVRLIVRRAIQYALARYAVVLVASIPVTIIAVTLYRGRQRSIADLATGTTGALLALLLGMTWLASRGRRGVLENLDRRFFREQYDSRQILSQLVDRCQRVSGREELSEMLRTEITRALHPESISVLFLDPGSGRFTSPRGDVQPLGATATIVSMVNASDAPKDVDLERDDVLSQSLPPNDRNWLVDGGVRLLVPLKDAVRQTVGLISLGEKRSELPYSAEDRQLLSTVGSAASLALAFLSVHPRAGSGSLQAERVSAADAARECRACSTVAASGTTSCPRCGSEMIIASIPHLLAGKFRVVERLGAGGMGVVYKARDEELDRFVAIKTLPHMSSDQALRLRREARAMAAVSHANLALIYGAESWQGIPMLIVEYLGGGTLDKALSKQRMPVADALDLGITLAGVLGAIHRAGILHRDIKPSNIGFTATGTPKLLDFGLARLLSVPNDRGSPVTTGERRTDPFATMLSMDDLSVSATADGVVVGTVLYLPPEALIGGEPDPSFDVWATCVVLFEAMSGRNPVQDTNPMLTYRRIATCDVADLRDLLPTASPELAGFFRKAFSVDPAQRPRTADALRAQLQRERQALVLPA
jgi:tRNA A-37 threonylcarbamoyl transferase component Bud32